MKITAKRIVAERRAVLLPLAVVLAVNLAITAVIVIPMSLRVRDAKAQAVANEQARHAAQRDYDDAQKTKVGKERVSEELRRFYNEILPPDRAGARRITYLRLALLARQDRLEYEHRSSSADRDADSQLGRLKMSMVLQGEYSNVRKFIHDLETAPEFVVIDDVSLAQGSEPASPLVLTVELSTYFRFEDNGD
jgi:hypothetical protein